MALLTPRRARSSGPPTPVEAAPPLEAGDTLVDLFFDRAARWSERPALRHWQDGAWQTMTWAEYGAAVCEVAAGAVSVPAYPTGGASQLAHVPWTGPVAATGGDGESDRRRAPADLHHPRPPPAAVPGVAAAGRHAHVPGRASPGRPRDAHAAGGSERQLIELCRLVGHYEMLAMTLNSLGVEPEPSALARLSGAPSTQQGRSGDRSCSRGDQQRRPGLQPGGRQRHPQPGRMSRAPAGGLRHPGPVHAEPFGERVEKCGR
jgi:hypothetical protein